MTFGFIVTRHVNSESTNRYWNHNVQMLSTHYPNNQIVIIDDDSDESFLKADFEYKNVIYIQSVYKKRGELLAYVYYLQNKWFDVAVMIHDSTFFHKYYDFNEIKQGVILWHFENNKSEIPNVLRIAESLTNNEIIKDKIIHYDRHDWISCQGVQSIINHDFLIYLNDKYSITNLISIVKNRSDRCALERIFGVMLSIEPEEKSKSFLGCINTYDMLFYRCDYTFDQYIKSFNNKHVSSPVMKVWSGR